MKSPSPCSYHQNATAVPSSTNSSAIPTRLRSSRRWPIRVIVAAASRSGRRGRRNRPAVLTGGISTVLWSALVIGGGRASLLGTRPGLDCAGLCGARLGLVVDGLGRHGRRGRGRDDLAGHRRGAGLVLGADVVVLHALHLALEDAQRAAHGTGGVGQLLVAEEQQDGEDDQADLHRAEVHRILRVVGCRRLYAGTVAGSALPEWPAPRPPAVQSPAADGSVRWAATFSAVACSSTSTGRTSSSSPRTSRRSRPAAPTRL